jgi:hypothetical protein
VVAGVGAEFAATAAAVAPFFFDEVVAQTL